MVASVGGGAVGVDGRGIGSGAVGVAGGGVGGGRVGGGTVAVPEGAVAVGGGGVGGRSGGNVTDDGDGFLGGNSIDSGHFLGCFSGLFPCRVLGQFLPY